MRKGKIFRPTNGSICGVDYRDILRANLTALLADSGDTSRSLARRAYYQAGTKKGERVSERTIRYILDPSPTAPSPALDVLGALAAAFKLDGAYQLLVPRLDPADRATARSGKTLEQEVAARVERRWRGIADLVAPLRVDHEDQGRPSAANPFPHSPPPGAAARRPAAKKAKAKP